MGKMNAQSKLKAWEGGHTSLRVAAPQGLWKEELAANAAPQCWIKKKKKTAAATQTQLNNFVFIGGWSLVWPVHSSTLPVPDNKDRGNSVISLIGRTSQCVTIVSFFTWLDAQTHSHTCTSFNFHFDFILVFFFLMPLCFAVQMCSLN